MSRPGPNRVRARAWVCLSFSQARFEFRFESEYSKAAVNV
jgi:hypothetical protein